MLQKRTLEVLDQLIQDADFLGASDPSALSLLAVYIRVRQPALILELGTYIGFSALVLADIVSHNLTPGRLITVEPAKDKLAKAQRFIQRAGLASAVDFVIGKSTDQHVLEQLRQQGPFNVIYIDSSHSYRETLEELQLYCTDRYLSDDKTIFFFHDVGRKAQLFDPTGEGGVHHALEDWIADKLAEFQLFMLEPPIWPNPVGLGILSRRTTKPPETASAVKGVVPTPLWALPSRALRLLSEEGAAALWREAKSYVRWRASCR